MKRYTFRCVAPEVMGGPPDTDDRDRAIVAQDGYWEAVNRETGEYLPNDAISYDEAKRRLELVAALAAVYEDHPVAIAELCDKHLDRRGALLGRVRSATRGVGES